MPGPGGSKTFPLWRDWEIEALQKREFEKLAGHRTDTSIDAKLARLNLPTRAGKPRTGTRKPYAIPRKIPNQPDWWLRAQQAYLHLRKFDLVHERFSMFSESALRYAIFPAFRAAKKKSYANWQAKIKATKKHEERRAKQRTGGVWERDWQRDRLRREARITARMENRDVNQVYREYGCE